MLFLKEEAVIHRWDGLPVNAELWNFGKSFPIASLGVLFPEQAP